MNMKLKLTRLLIAMCLMHLTHGLLLDRFYSFLNDDNTISKDRFSDVKYTVAILRKFRFLCTGALLSESWVITDANDIYMMKGALRELRIRLGSMNYKEGGMLSAIKYIELHPKFKTTSPQYDIAMLRLAQPVTSGFDINFIRLQTKTPSFNAHYLVTFWNENTMARIYDDELYIKKSQLLKYNQMHQKHEDKCLRSLMKRNVTKNENIMCLDPAENIHQTWSGSPVALKRFLVGVISSWMPSDNDQDPALYVNMVSVPSTYIWIQHILHAG